MYSYFFRILKLTTVISFGHMCNHIQDKTWAGIGGNGWSWLASMQTLERFVCTESAINSTEWNRIEHFVQTNPILDVLQHHKTTSKSCGMKIICLMQSRTVLHNTNGHKILCIGLFGEEQYNVFIRTIGANTYHGLCLYHGFIKALTCPSPDTD